MSEEYADTLAQRPHSFPVLVGELIPGMMGRRGFPFIPWAAANGFVYPWESRHFMQRCGSAVEAFFARVFCKRAGVEYPDERTARCGSATLELQAQCTDYYIDALVSDDRTSLAIEIDGMGFHRMTKEQVATDYLRQRRIVLKGHTVIRFTAQEVLVSPDECWRQVEAILAARGKN